MGEIIPIDDQTGELTEYNPERGLYSIATLEAAVIHFSRAKDVKKLFESVQKKLEEQRKFVRWWDGLGEKRGSGPSKRRNRSVTSLPVAGRDGLPSRMVIKRWREATTDARFATTLAEIQEQCRKICEGEKPPTRGTGGTGENEWFTPAEYIELARTVLGGIDLDPATHPEAQKIVQATEFYTKADDGLAREWHGRVWLNPPYAQPFIAQFISKLVSEWKAGRILSAIVLTHNYTDSDWFQELASEACCVCFTNDRIRFYQPDGKLAQPTQGQVFSYFGDNIGLFAGIFNETGFMGLWYEHIKRLGLAAPSLKFVEA